MCYVCLPVAVGAAEVNPPNSEVPCVGCVVAVEVCPKPVVPKPPPNGAAAPNGGAWDTGAVDPNKPVDGCPKGLATPNGVDALPVVVPNPVNPVVADVAGVPKGLAALNKLPAGCCCC